jgi:hypothetical protein
MSNPLPNIQKQVLSGMNAAMVIMVLILCSIPSHAQGFTPSFDVPTSSPLSATVTSVIWAEESGALVVNTNGQFSFGNGATGYANYGMPIWEEMEAVGMVLNAEVKGTSTTIGYTINAVLRPAEKQITATEHTTVFYFAESEVLTQGQLLNFRTTAEVGAWSDVRVGLIIRQKIQFE